MLGKVKAAVDARQDQDLQIVARTDARAVLGINAAIDRAHAMIEAGADVTFVESPTSEAEMARIAKELAVPQIANIVYGGKTPDLGRTRLAEMGFAGVLFANAALQAALRASYDVLTALNKDGSLKNVGDRLAGFDERQRAVAKPKFDMLEKTYQTGAFAPRSELTQ
jgi:2-methylisocitrate lyase-like PEP mutase family enzyme